MSSDSSRLPPLRRNRDYGILWSAQALSALGANASSIAYMLVVLAITHSAVAVGAVGTVRTVVSFGAGLVGGLWVDRMDRRKVVVICETARGLVMASVAVLVVTHVSSLYPFLVAAALGGLFAAPVGPALQAALVRVVPSEQFRQAMAQEQARQEAGSLVGPSLGGLLFGVAAWLPFSFDAFTYIASAVGVLAISADLRNRQSSPELGGVWADVTGGIRWLLANRPVAQTCLSLGVVTLSGGGISTLVLVFVRRGGASSFETGIALAIGAGAGLAGAAISSRMLNWLGEFHCVLLTLWTIVAVIPAAALAPNFAGLTAVLAIASFVTPMSVVVFGAKLIPLVPDNLRGRVEAAVTVTVWGLGALGPLFAGGLIDVLGTFAPVVMAAPALVGAIAVTSLSDVRSFITSPPPASQEDK